ncbi:sulfotransferase [Microbulbifer sp. S227A]|uniref:tetratricopeptide repeat-containing sulfotransferase family protein n=1 Tax=Microbulbifer sp. S227A TaxID=3415131 RepID=UPI003C7B4075
MSVQTQTQARQPHLDVRKLLARAEGARRAGDITGAARDYGTVLSRFPGNPRARKALAAIGPSAASILADKAQQCQQARQLDAAAQHWAEAVALRPEHAGLGISLCRCLLDMGRSNAALEAVNTVLQHNPQDPVALDTKGCILRDLGRLDAARDCHIAAMQHDGDRAGPLNHLGIIAQANGDMQQAADHFTRAIALSPDIVSLHHNLAGCKTYTPDDPHLSQMQEILARRRKDDPELAALHFALFKALDDTGDTDAAFAHLLQGNQLRKAASEFDIAQEAQRFAWYKSLLPDPPKALAPDLIAAPRPVFVVGLPRSGTTLVERILSQSDDTQPAGELSVVPNAVAPLLRRLQGENRPAPSRDDLLELRARIVAGLGRHSDGSAVLIDKMPLNFRWVGLICAAMPEARIVSLRRAPMPVAWSLFRHMFSSPGNGFAYGMADIAAYMLLHRDMMRFWSDRFGAQIVDLAYADLVTDTERTIRRLIAACDLNWTEACLAPQTADAPVLTASAGQVRRGIYRNSDQSWRKYQTQLSPLATALRAAGLS